MSLTIDLMLTVDRIGDDFQEVALVAHLRPELAFDELVERRHVVWHIPPAPDARADVSAQRGVRAWAPIAELAEARVCRDVSAVVVEGEEMRGAFMEGRRHPVVERFPLQRASSHG